MNISKEQLIKDLSLETVSVEVQDKISASFFNGLQAKVQLSLLDRLSDDQQKAFETMNEEQQDALMTEASGGDLDAFVDEQYKESVAEFIIATKS
jgi:nicotinate-nucleotide pyrophosphorylase